MSDTCPCRDCESRTPTCHCDNGECPYGYREWRDRLTARNTHIKNEMAKELALDLVARQRMEGHQ